MKLFENTRAYFGKRKIESVLQTEKRQMHACNINEAKSIGILFNATHQVSFEIVKDLVKNLSSKKNTVDVLGYVDSKQLIDHYLYRKGFEFFTHKQLNWYYKPETENAKAFIQKEFDILMDLSLDEPFPIKYILACSKAKFKTGRYSPEQKYLDFMIDIEKEKDAMNDIKLEIDRDIENSKRRNRDVEKIIDLKTQTEIQINFLINHLIHYLSIIKN